MIQVNRIYLIFNRLVTKKFLVDTSDLKYSFNITTSRGQTDFKRSIKDLRDFIRNKNVEAKQIVVLDGAGWIGRQSDLRDAWDYCDYCLNLQHIEDLKEIIKL